MTSETLLSIINKLGLSEIVEEWVKQTWQADFTDIDSLPEEIETTLVQNAYYRQQWKLLGDELDTWTASESQETSLWTTLVENDVGHKRLIAFIFYITEVGSKRLASSDQRLAAIQASNVYYKLILIPGSGAFQIFHPFLFEKVVDVMKEWCHSHQAVNISSSQKRKSSPKRSSKSSKRGRGSRAGRDIDSEDEDFGEDDDDDAAEHQFTAAENKVITKAIMDLIRTFVSLLRSYSLQDSEHSLSVTYELLADLTKIEPETYSPQRFQGDGNLRNVLSFPQLAYMGLYAVASNRHGEIHRMYNSTMKNLLSGILMFVGPNNAVATPNIPRSIKNIKDHSIHFVKTLLTQNLDNAVISARTLIQHMSTKVPDKTEYKTNVAQAIVMILKDFSVYEYSRMLLWFQKLSKAEKIPWRGFSVEVVSLLLHEPLREADDLVTDELLNCLTHNFLLQIILSRCNDVSPTVRARAIHLFSDCASSSQDLVQQALREIITPMSSTRLPRSRYEATPKKTIGDTPSESSSACCTIGNSKLSSGVVNSENSVENSQTAEQTGDNSNNVPGNTDKSATENSSNAKTNESTNTEMSTVNNTGRTSTSTVNSTDNRTGDRTMGRTMFVPAGSEISLADNSGVISMLRHRAQDDKVYVRKSSVSAMEVLIKANPDCITQQNMEIFEARCLDVSLSVRKQALISITELLLHHPTSVLIHKCWLNRVPYLIKDRENSVQEKCLEVLESVILDNITTYERSVDEQHQLLWSLLQIVSGVEGTTHRLYLSEAFRLWSKTGKIKPFLTKALQSHLVTENKKSAWTLLFLMAPFIPKMDTTFIIDYWKDNAQELVNDTEDETFHSVLQVISYMAKLLKPDDQRFFSQNLLKLVMKFCCSPKIISSLVTAIDLLETALNKDNENTSSWCNPVMSACDKYLSNAILNENQDVSINEDEMMGYIYTLGDVAQLIPNRIPRRVFLLIQSIIAAPQITPNDGVTQKPASQESEGNDDDPENVSPSQEVPASQGVPYSQGITGSQPILSQFSGSKMSVRIRAYAFITLGKLCLQHDDIAKKCIPALGRELETSRDAPVRNNVVIALCDLFKIHTTYVERYTNSISACLRDPVPLIRYQTLIMITELLQEDYMKWKGPLFYRYIIALLDDHKVITNFIQYCLVHLVLIRHPAMFFHHFVEALFYFNGYEGHSMYNHFDQTEKEKQLFCLNGQQNSSKRMTLYTFLLQNLSDEYKFQVSAKLCQEILGGFVDNVIPLNSETSSLLQDALQILYSKEIKLTTLKSKSNDDVVEEQDMEQAVINAAKKQIITKVVKKDVIENIVPVVIALKHLLEKEHSVVLKSLMLYLRELMKDYKDEVKDILSADRQLANEIEFDLKKFERDEEERNEQSTVNRINSPQKDANRHTPGKNLQTPARTRNPPTVTTPGRGLATPARVLTTPARGLATPGRLVGTPFKTPLKAMQTPQQMPRTPRNLPMSTQVIMNSARKAMEHRVSHVPSGLLTPRQSSITAGSLTELRKQKKVVVWADKENNTDTFDDDSRKSTNLSGGTQSERKHNERRRILSRAISTPHRGLTLGNITFQQLDTDISAIVPSPINSRDSSDWVHDDLSADKDRRSDKQPVKHVLHMPSPDQPAPKPRRWNLKARNSKSLDGATKRLSLQSMDTDTNTVSNLTDTTQQKESAAAKPTTKETNPRRSSSRTRKSTAETPNVDVEMPKTPADTQDIHADTPRRSSRHNTSVTSAKPNSPKVARRKSIRNK